MSRIGQSAVDAHNNGDCWTSTCPLCELENTEPRCRIGIHDWMQRGTPNDRWRECFLCGEQVDV